MVKQLRDGSQEPNENTIIWHRVILRASSSIMYKILSSEKSKCTHEGCSKVLKGEDLQRHEINCGYRKISCPLSAFKKCSEEIRIKDAKSHLKEHRTKSTAGTIPKSYLNYQIVTWVKPNPKGSFANPEKSSFCMIKCQNVFFFVENGSLKDDNVFKIYAFLIDSPKKAKNLSLQTKAKHEQLATLYLTQSGPVNALDEQNAEPCFTMTQEEIREIRKEAKKTFFEFQVLDQTPKKSVMQFAYKNCKKILQMFQ